MRWHQGTIPEAVAAAKQSHSIFIVFIYGNEEQSNKMEECLNNETLSNTLTSNCVSLKLEANSDGAKMFSQIYPVVLIPSLFFIGVNGIPLEVIGGAIEPHILLEKINKILEMHDQQKEGAATCATGSSSSSVAPDLGECSKTMQSAKETTPRSEACVNTEETPENAESGPVAPLNERLERAKVLISQRQEEKAREEFEKEKQREIERRQLGKNLHDFKQKQKDMENKKMAEEIVRERAEEKAARENIRQQIARDRAERATKYQTEKDAEDARKQAALQVKRDQANAEAASRSNYARLQLKLPDGTPLIHQFAADLPLQEVYNFVKETVKPPLPSFRLCLIFPRRDFQKGDYSQTLRDLQLVPNASLLIIPESSKSVIQSSPGVNNLIWTLLSPILALWRFFCNFIYGAPANPRSSAPKPPTASGANTTRASGMPESKKPRLSTPQDSNRPFTRREGNIHRIAGENDDEDENNTWNGNSTQQM